MEMEGQAAIYESTNWVTVKSNLEEPFSIW